ncbi:bifunctional glutamate N-acetyltransferase/amino-acid acetyltransferase ArgJ [Mobiluncus curtisii]|uniref:Arginine biosynthesis bifunctional protein ArgJ n=1 Tax=Mobiluncus curtisii TaxID=2051 RepID=A0A7Y0UGE6_9ACTO|nr:bifunctional glutamate N-acetyltransferase/amino-acid acetyltransferase ArgJ [Mobiluncus curtisii]MCU9988086.1 bifunctional glutamate N-acetyltransferase/amino-acid acetyltransferase ArgJ [Mobiluncus curtisii]MCV0001303.1 bifunctional glutamate N-acetyltransferase/amino-acid acetyltransferase ArgJ [Mobiluncus curtisii]NMW50122.1 bifunctional glutamate N-acetyltransferase/amino-acid acetyltransferase ArgJ [Mobiluncus curtisii]NMW86852.1 bifunctional glutamate N-acetyltransferase/amino-acid ac
MSVTYPRGFKAAGDHVGLRGKLHPDMAIVRNLGPDSTVAGVFTSNRVFAAPVGWDRKVVAGGRAQAVVINSAIANACTGEQGDRDAAAMAAHLGQVLGVAENECLVCSTGIIGRALNMPKMTAGIDTVAAKLSENGGAEAAEAILTTDTKAKTVTHESPAGWRIGGMAKGAGMLAPALATMIVVLTTDAVGDSATMQTILSQAVDRTFNRLDSDGCMSTNDTVLLLASGASGVKPDPDEFAAALLQVCEDLALQLLRDAEGAHHDIEIRVTGAASEAGALEAARTISRSNLVKTAVYGNDPNWGRILSQLGTVPEDVLPFDPARVDVSINGVKVCKNGGIGEDPYLADMSPRECHILVELHAGQEEAHLWTSDLTHEYVHINGDYTT